MNLEEIGRKLDALDGKVSAVHDWAKNLNGALSERCPAHSRRIGNLEKCLWGLVVGLVLAGAGVGLRAIMGG